MAPHQAKRPYAGSQPSITSYFHSISSTSQPTYAISPQPSETRSPSLPTNVQSNLLSVGMRVRKSVPEGYKTGSYSAFTLFQDAAPVVAQGGVKRLGMGLRPRARELTPFCGLMKVGGMAEQQWEPLDDEEKGDEYDEDDDDMPALSQGSTVSNASTATLGGANKRRFEVDDDDEEDTKAVGLGGRAIAVPRRLRKGVEKIRITGQENLGDADFEDAEFLDYGLIGRDEEMGGV